MSAVAPIEAISAVTPIHTVHSGHAGGSIGIQPTPIESSTAPGTAVSAAAAALQEAIETPAQTEEEARTGDPVAIKKLYEEHLQAHVLSHEPGKGDIIDAIA